MPNLQAFERSEYQQVKADLHRKILDRLDLEKLGRSSGDSARDEVLDPIGAVDRAQQRNQCGRCPSGQVDHC